MTFYSIVITFCLMVAGHIGDYFTTSLFDVLLPTIDTTSDISLATSWYIEGHTAYATAMAVPPMINYCFAWYKWWSNDKIFRMKWSWIFVLTNFYHQMNAIRLMGSFRNNDQLDVKKKQKMLNEVSSLDPYLESAPSVMIMSMIWLSALTGNGIEPFGGMVKDHSAGYFDCSNASANGSEWVQMKSWKRKQIHVDNFCAVFQGAGGLPWFFFTFCISLFSTSLGITKFLQNGPCAILSNVGSLGGLLNWKFILVFISVMFSISAKCVFAVLVVGAAFGDNYSLTISGLIFFGINVLPHILCSIIMISLVTGCSRKLYKIILKYPALVSLPVFTYFSVGPKNLPRCRRDKTRHTVSHIILSTKWTIVNIMVTLMLYGCTISLLLTAYPKDISTYWIQFAGIDYKGYETYFKIVFAPVMIISLIPTLIFLLLHLSCCFCPSKNCCCSCCCSTKCLKFKDDYIDVSEY